MKESDFNSREEFVQARLKFLKEKLAELGELFQHTDPETDPEEELAFLEHIYVLESQPTITHAHQLIENGVCLPSPNDLSEAQLHDKLWEVIDKLAELRVFLENTNHLNDRSLYEQLWTETLNEFTWDMSHSLNGALHIDMCGSGSEEDTENWLRFYASEVDRAQWAADFPDEKIPPRQMPLVDRDDKLPQPHHDFEGECGGEEDDFDDFDFPFGGFSTGEDDDMPF